MDLTPFSERVQIPGQFEVGGDKMLLIAGPCAIESLEICTRIAESMVQLTDELDINYIFKASFDKANRTSGDSFRTIGMQESLEILNQVKQRTGVSLITDVHESAQVPEVASVVDMLQIPAFLCRQTDLLVACGLSKKAVNIKKGQFMAPEDMQYAVHKVKETQNPNVLLTERGTTFGYHNLVVDYRSIPQMRKHSPVIFDVTHSVQQPGGAGGSSGGQREFASYLAQAAAAVGVDGFFIETHPNPEKALSDGPNMVPLPEMPHFIKKIKQYWDLQKEINSNN